MNAAQLVQELMGATCRCGKPKSIGKTFCFSDYKRLPRQLQRRLYNHVGDGYEEAYGEATKILDGLTSLNAKGNGGQ